MARTLTDGEVEILTELNAEAFEDATIVDMLDCEADIIAEIYADLDAARENKRLLQEHEQAHIAAMLATDVAQAALWNSPPF